MILDLVDRFARCENCGTWKKMQFTFTKMKYVAEGTEHLCKDGITTQIKVQDIERDPLVTPRYLTIQTIDPHATK